MKVNFDIECTPEEAHAFLGLQNDATMQARMMEEMEKKIQENMNNLDPETLFKTWLPMTFQGWNEMQKMFWDQMMNAASGSGTGTELKKDAK